MEPIRNSIEREAAGSKILDAIVFGAGVGGSIAAIEIAAAGHPCVLIGFGPGCVIEAALIK